MAKYVIDERDVKIPAKTDAVWTKAGDLPAGKLQVAFSAKGAWKFAPWAPECGPNGFAEDLIDRTRLIMQDARIATLIGKHGGGAAALAAAEPFAVGAALTLELELAAASPLYLTINDLPNGLDDNEGEMTASIRIYAL